MSDGVWVLHAAVSHTIRPYNTLFFNSLLKWLTSVETGFLVSPLYSVIQQCLSNVPDSCSIKLLNTKAVSH